MNLFLKSILKFLLFFLLLGNTPSYAEVKSNDSSSTPIDSFKRPDKIENRLISIYSQETIDNLAKLGKFLFYDPRLSESKLMSCATCHNPSFFWTDSLKVNIERGTRRSMSLLNVASDKQFSWQGLSRSLTSLIKLPLIAPNGMHTSEAQISKTLSEIPQYQEEFRKAFAPIAKTNSIPYSYSTVGLALEAYITTIISPVSRFDKFVAGETSLFSAQEFRGFELFRGKAGCASCHSTWKLSDGEMYDIGVIIDPEERDLYKGQALFKAVGLRAISRRPPYMHNGSLATLEDVIEFYNKGGDIKRPTFSDKIKPLNLSNSEKEDLVAFLKALDEEPLVVNYPILPR